MPILARRKLWTVAVFTVLFNVLDLVSTYVASPDLANEWNVLARVYGLGWLGLIGAKLVGGALAVAGYWYYLKHRDSCYPVTFVKRRDFVRYMAYGGGNVRAGLTDSVRLGIKVGYFWAGMQIIVLWVALDNFLLTRGFVMPGRAYSELGYHLAQSAVIAVFVLWRYYHTNYRRFLLLGRFCTTIYDDIAVVSVVQQHTVGTGGRSV